MHTVEHVRMTIYVRVHMYVRMHVYMHVCMCIYSMDIMCSCMCGGEGVRGVRWYCDCPSLQGPIPALPCQHCLCEGHAGVLDPSAPGGPPQTDQCIPRDRGRGREEARQEQGQGGGVPAGPVCGGRGGAEGSTAGTAHVSDTANTLLFHWSAPPACAPWGQHHMRSSGLVQ